MIRRESDYKRWHGHPDQTVTIELKPISQVDILVASMQEIAQQGEEKRSLVASLARHAVTYIYAQKGENQFRRTAVYCEKVDDNQAIILAGNVLRKFSDRPTTIGRIATMTVASMAEAFKNI